MNDFPWTPQHAGQPEDADAVIVEATEEVVPDSGDQDVPAPAPAEDEEVVVSKPTPEKPAAKKTSPKKNVTRTKKSR